MDWASVDWPALEKLRAVFLRQAGADADSTGAASGPYWNDPRQLASYDFTFGRRIAWKWAAVLEPLFARGWKPRVRRLVDWGCGTGIGARSVLAYAPAESFDDVILWDHAPAATTFAAEVIRTRYPSLNVSIADPAVVAEDDGFVLVLSHVLNELDPGGRAALLTLARRAAAILWVEPGTREDSHALIAMREALRDVFGCVAPCPHDGACGLLLPENARHWCHHFAPAPTEAFTESGWAEFGRRLGIDLRSLPYSYLVLDRHALPTANDRPPDRVRLIGTPRESSGIMRVLRCRGPEDVREVELQKRSDPGLWRALAKGRHHGRFVWREDRDRITEGSVDDL